MISAQLLRELESENIFEFRWASQKFLYSVVQRRALTSLLADRSEVPTPRRYLCEKPLERCL